MAEARKDAAKTSKSLGGSGELLRQAHAVLAYSPELAIEVQTGRVHCAQVAAMDRRDQWTRPAGAPIAAAAFSVARLEEENKRLRAEDKRLRAAPVAQDLAPSPVEEQLAADARRAKIERASERARRISRRFR